MYDSFAQLPGLQALGFAGIGAAQGSSLFALAGLTTGLVGAPSFRGVATNLQNVNVAAGLSGYLGTGQAGVSPWNTGTYATAAPGAVQGNVASYQANWATSGAGNVQWYSVGGRQVVLNGGMGAYAWSSQGSQTGGVLGYHTCCCHTTRAQTSWQKVPHVSTEQEWPAASKIVASRLVGSTEGQARIHFKGQNPWSNVDGNNPERTAVWRAMQKDGSLRYDVDRKVLFRTNLDGSTTTVASAQNNNGNGNGVGNGNGNGNGTGQPTDPGQPGDPGNNPGVPPGNSGNNPPGSNPGNNPPDSGGTTDPGNNPGLPPGNPGNNPPGTNPGNNPPDNGGNPGGPPPNPPWWLPYEMPGYPPVGDPGQPPSGGNPSTGIPGPYPGDPGVGIPSMYTDNGSVTAGIPSMYLENGNPSTGIPIAYLMGGNPAWGIPAPYLFGYI